MQAERLSAYKAAPAAMRAVQQVDAWKRVDPAGSSFTNATIYALTGLYDWANRAAWVAAALSVPLFLYIAVYAAPAARVISQQQEREAIERENIVFCEKHGMPVGTHEYALCAEDLMDIRAKQGQRTAEDMGRTF